MFDIKKKILVTSLFLGCSLLNADIFDDAQGIADQFYELAGDPSDPHKKVNHNKGFCTTGEFIPAKNLNKVLNVPMLNEKNIHANVRFSLGGGNPKQSDASKGRGMAIKLNSQNESWEFVMTNAEIFFAQNIPEFKEFFQLMIDLKNKTKTPEEVAKRRAEVPSYANYFKYVGAKDSFASFSDETYFSSHTFYFTDNKGKERAAKWKFVPVKQVKALSKEELEALGSEFLEENLKKELANKPVTFKMSIILANENDITDNPTVFWTGKHKEIELGTLKISKYEGKGCNPDVYMPNVLPTGVSEPKDPLFEVRNLVYTYTFGRRQ